MQAAPLLKQIADAFPPEPVPGRDEILHAGALAGESEVEEIRAFFAGRPWSSVTPPDIFRFRHALSFFSPRALAYYTAAWMTCALLDEDAVDTAIEDLVGTAERVEPDLWTRDQKAAILGWLLHFRDTGSSSFRRLCEKAVRKFVKMKG